MSERRAGRNHAGTWQIEVTHSGLSRSKVITGTDRLRLESKAAELGASWDNEWIAIERSAEGKNAVDELQSFLSRSLSMPHSLDWEFLKDWTTFTEREPTQATLVEIPPEPQPSDAQYDSPAHNSLVHNYPTHPLVNQIITAVLTELRATQPPLEQLVVEPPPTPLDAIRNVDAKPTWRNRLNGYFFGEALPHAAAPPEVEPPISVAPEVSPPPSPPIESIDLPVPVRAALGLRLSEIPKGLRQQVEQQTAKRYLLELEEQEAIRAKDESDRLIRARADWQEKKQKIERANALIQSDYAERFAEWDQRRSEFLSEQERQHLAIDALKSKYVEGDAVALADGLNRVLARWPYPTCCQREHHISFDGDTGIIVIDERLPTLDDMPTLKEVRYLKGKNELSDIMFSATELRQIYDSLAYQIFLRTLHFIYKFDSKSHIKAVVYNGWIEFVDPATGRDTKCCIMSAHVEREAFLSLDLSRVDPRACFKALKGIGSPNLHTMTPVAPLMRTSTKDSRFVESREVVDQLRDGTNVAAIGWEDFEHLIREIFQKELSQSGAEVKVTRASRDGGVDAIAFDPDPIRGGKIVIQAKRYTNTVEVSAVRDLYGTILNEGATKGILVTTSNFGPDAYSFAKDKPITLLDGSNLLHLLERHGHRAYIDLAEAKKLNLTPLARTFSDSS